MNNQHEEGEEKRDIYKRQMQLIQCNFALSVEQDEQIVEPLLQTLQVIKSAGNNINEEINEQTHLIKKIGENVGRNAN